SAASASGRGSRRIFEVLSYECGSPSTTCSTNQAVSSIVAEVALRRRRRTSQSRLRDRWTSSCPSLGGTRRRTRSLRVVLPKHAAGRHDGDTRGGTHALGRLGRW